MGRIIDRLLTRKNFFRGSAILALTTFLSYALGLLRDRLLATTFGASRALDAYNAAFNLPDLILNIFVAGALTAAFVPIFSDLKKSERLDEAREFINSVINSSLLAVAASGLAVFIFAPFLSKFMVPGFDPIARQTFVNLVRILLLSPIIFSISNTLGSIIITHEKFFWYGISASFYNAGTILGAVFLTRPFGIYGIAIGTIAGALMHLACRIIGLTYHHRYHPVIRINFHFRQFLRLMLPKVIGQPIEQLTFVGFTIIASLIGPGSIAILNFAHNFQSMPINTIGATLGLTAFPILSRLSTPETQKEFRREVRFTLQTIILISVSGAVAIYFFNVSIPAFTQILPSNPWALSSFSLVTQPIRPKGRPLRICSNFY